MIIPISGNVTYQITLDPTVWIFDDRKILFEEAFQPNINGEESSGIEEAARRWERAIYPQHTKPPVNRSISRMEGKELLKNSYVMPIKDFVEHAEIKDGANTAIIETTQDEASISIDQLKNSYMLFSWNGKQLQEEGPAHLYFKDGSNKENPIKGIQKIRIV